jgi:cysteine synthase A
MNIESLIGNTPLVKLSDKIHAKLETYNPTGSIKDRMASYILKKAEESGDLRPGDTIVEASSGNTGISFSMLASVKGYNCIIIMPKNMSRERKSMMEAYGARVIEVGDNQFHEAIKTRDSLVKNCGSFWSPKQFSNQYNIECHEKTTAIEIIRSVLGMSETGEVSAIVSGAGTGGTIMGCRNQLYKVWRDIKTVLVMPAEDAATHGIQGINDGADFLVNREIIDDIIAIKTEDAKNRAKLIAKEHGLLVGISSGANVLAAEKWVEKNEPKDIVVTFLCDRGERYLSCD